jgi:preprotein translocase subunit SecE
MSAGDTPTSLMDRVRGFSKDVSTEAQKVSWPTMDELRDSTTVVIITVLLVAAFIGIVDQLLNRAVGLIFH